MSLVTRPTILVVTTLGAVLVSAQLGPVRSHVTPSFREDPAMSTVASQAEPHTAPALTHLAPVLIVDQIEPCVAFWVERFGFTAKNQVPGPDGKLLFASVERDGIEIMYQTRASVAADNPAAARELDGRPAALFITVENLDQVERAVAGAPVVKPRHQTFYGSTELYIREPGGNTVGFAQF